MTDSYTKEPLPSDATPTPPYPNSTPYPHEPPPTYNNDQQGGPNTFTPAYPNATAPTHVIITTPPLSSSSTRVTCPHCQADVSTAVSYETSGMTHCCALVLCCLVCWPLAWVPYVTDCTKDAQHECPNCNRHIGTYKR